MSLYLRIGILTEKTWSFIIMFLHRKSQYKLILKRLSIYGIYQKTWIICIFTIYMQLSGQLNYNKNHQVQFNLSIAIIS